MKKLKVSADGYIIGTVVFWVIFIAMVVFSSIIFKVLGWVDPDTGLVDRTKALAGLPASQFVGIMFLLGLFIGLVVMMNFASLLLVSNKYASSANYKAESKWAVSVFALNLIFTAIFITWFVINVLMSPEVAEVSGQTTLLDDKVLFSITKTIKPAVEATPTTPATPAEVISLFDFKISTIVNCLAVIGFVFGIIAFSLSIAVSNRIENVVKKIKEYEKVNIY